MNKLIFVYYEHGCGGENLSYRISKHPLCNELVVKIKNGRTVIENDLFNKIFLGARDNFQYNFHDNEKLCQDVLKNFKGKIDEIEKYTVVPSHINVSVLQKYFLNSFFVIINPPNTPEQHQKYLNHIYECFWLYKTKNIKEYVGEIYCRINASHKQKTEKEVKTLTSKILFQYKNLLSFGQIQCAVNNIEPTTKNMKKLFFSLYKNKKFKNYVQMKDQRNILNIPYDSVKEYDIENIFQYFKIV